MALKRVRFDEDIGSLVDSDNNMPYDGRRISNVVCVRNVCPVVTADGSRLETEISLEFMAKKYTADAYELVSSSTWDEYEGQEYVPPSYITELMVILYQN